MCGKMLELLQMSCNIISYQPLSDAQTIIKLNFKAARKTGLDLWSFTNKTAILVNHCCRFILIKSEH